MATLKQGVNRHGPMSRSEAARRLALHDMTSAEITAVLGAADSSLEPVTDGLPWRVADVYGCKIFGGYTIAFRRGVVPVS